MPTDADPERCYVWRRILDDASLEHARLRRRDDGIELAGTIVAVEANRPLKIEYLVHADARWNSRSVRVAQEYAGRFRRLLLERHDDGGWTVDGVDAPALSDCVDIDLELSPITNALPINRLALPIGGEVEIRVAWVRFPGLTVEAAMQRYARSAAATYRFTSVASGFNAGIEVDDLGIPRNYEGIWRLLAADDAE